MQGTWSQSSVLVWTQYLRRWVEGGVVARSERACYQRYIATIASFVLLCTAILCVDVLA